MCVYVMYFLMQHDYGKVLDHSEVAENSTFNVEGILRKIESSRICNFYNKIMTYKHKLSHCLFNDATLTSEYTTKLTLLMINLQTAAGILQDMKVAINYMTCFYVSFSTTQMATSHLSCIEFTATEYELIYKSYENGMDVLRSLKDSAFFWKNKPANKCPLVNDSK